MILTPEKHAEVIATPSSLARHIGREVMGHEYLIHPWLLHLEREILAMLQRPGVEILIVSVPPQEGKSTYLSNFLPAWYIGMNPDNLTILATYADIFAEQHGMRVRNILDRWGQELFGVGISASMAASGNWRTTKGYGGMLSAGILGGLTGNPGHLILLDDLLKGFAAATSVATKLAVWNEIKNSVETRWQNDTKQVLLATRWAIDDPSGRYLEEAMEEDYNGPPVRYVNIKAQAEPTSSDYDDPDYQPETWRDILGRREGEFLRGQHTAEFFRMKKPGPKQDSVTWHALYQGEPQTREGGMFPKGRWRTYSIGELPRLVSTVRCWDLAASEDSGKDWSVGVKMGKSSDGDLYILDVMRFRKGPAEVMETVKATALADGRAVPVRIEQERSGAGKSTVAWYRKELLGWNFDGDRAEGTKEERAWPYSGYQQAGKVFLPVDAEWREKFVEEHALMMGDGRRPPHDDQIDAGAYCVLELLDAGEIELLDRGDLEGHFTDEAINDFMSEHGIIDITEEPSESSSGFMRALAQMANQATP